MKDNYIRDSAFSASKEAAAQRETLPAKEDCLKNRAAVLEDRFAYTPTLQIYQDHLYSRYQHGFIRLNHESLPSETRPYIHYHNCIELGLCLSGSGICYTDGFAYRFQQGDLQIFYPFQSHLSVSSPKSGSEWCFASIEPFYSPGNMLQAAVQNVSRLLHNSMGIDPILKPDCHPEITRLIHEILTEAAHSCLYSSEMLSLHIYELLIQVARESEGKPQKPLRITQDFMDLAPCIDYIQAHPLERITVKELTKKSHRSESNFRMVFKNAIGLTPKEYLTFVKMNYVYLALLKTNTPVSELCELVGYQDESTLYRNFVKWYGISLTKLRKFSDSLEKE